MSMTSCQEKADKFIGNFLASDAPEMVFSGESGCGKTWLLNHIDSKRIKAADFLDGKSVNPFTRTATTNQAAEVVGGDTVHSVFRLVPRKNWQTGEEFLHCTKENILSEDVVLIVDEAGTANTDLQDNILKYRGEAKIIWTGDDCQLPPVGMSTSPVFSRGLPQVHLETPVRQPENSHLYQVCKALRQSVIDGSNPNVQLGSDVLFATPKMITTFADNMTVNDMCLAYTNSQVATYGNYVRERKGMPSNWVVGEPVICNNHISVNGQTVYKNESKHHIMAIGSTFDKFGVECVSMDLGNGVVPVAKSSAQFHARKKHFAKSKNWKEYYQLQEQVADIRTSWASTVHKSQGSTYENVLIDLSDLKKCKFQCMNTYLRLLYVAFSRARGKVYVTY